MAPPDLHDEREPRQERIRARAYAIYLARKDKGSGSALEDWLRAERELADTVRATGFALNRDVGDGMSSGPEEIPELPDERATRRPAPDGHSRDRGDETRRRS